MQGKRIHNGIRRYGQGSAKDWDVEEEDPSPPRMEKKSKSEKFAQTIQESFGEVEDPRVIHLCKHKLLDIIGIALLAVIAGAEGWDEIEVYGQSKEEWLKTFLELPNGIPSADTFARVISNLDPEAMEAGFQSWVSQLADCLKGQLIALDGKTSRGSYDREGGVKALQLVSAWASEQKLVLGQCQVSSKSNEITAIPILIEQLNVKGAMVSIDAMGTQTTIAAQLRDKGADYLLALKGNQGNLHQQAEAWFAAYEAGAVSENVSQYQSCEAGHHRIEQRQVWRIPADEVFTPEQCEAWVDLASLVVVQAKRCLWNKTTLETRYFLSSATFSAQAFAPKIRGHWGIENPLHWSLDVVFGEDRSRLRRDHAPRNFSLLRRLSLNLLRQESSKGSLKGKRYRAGLDNRFMLKILAASSVA